TAPAESPGCAPPRLVASVGNGTVSIVAERRVGAGAWASTTPPRAKFTTGRPEPVLAKPCPATENATGGVARSIELGVMPVTHSVHGRVSVTVSVALTTSVKLAGPV